MAWDDYPVLAIDVDGTLIPEMYPHKPAPQDLKRFAKRVLTVLHNHKATVVIWTCRDRQQLVDIVDFCIQEGVPFDAVNDNTPATIAEIENQNPRKILATHYLDNRNVPPCTSFLYLFFRVLLYKSYTNKERLQMLAELIRGC